jgi:hypothetical protein
MMKKIPILLGLISICYACEEMLFEEEKASADPFENFEYLWQRCHEQYSYFELKNVNWVNVKQEYEQKLFEGMSQDSLFNVLFSMLNELKDDHVNLVSGFKTSFYGGAYQVQDNFEWRVIVDHYFDEPYQITGPFQHGHITNQNIVYVRLSSFATNLSTDHLDYILTTYAETTGLILDLRENGGGQIENVYKLLERFADEERIIAYSQIKNGIGQENFTAPEPVIVKPYSGIKYVKPVKVLTDAGTFSSGSLFALGTKAFPQITLIGQKTGGGLGMPAGGQLPNAWTYRFSVTRTLDLQMSQEPEQGVLPDIEVEFNWNDLTVDEILQEAIFQLQ